MVHPEKTSISVPISIHGKSESLVITSHPDDEIAEITISAPLLKRYKDNLNNFVGGLKQWCTKRGITYIFTTNHNPFDKLILNYLRERGLVK